MAKCIVFCAGGFTELLSPIGKEDFIIAADGGLKHTERLALIPDSVIGDFDSLGYTPENAAVFPVEKDDTDSMLAIRKAISLGYNEILLYGTLDGPRLDHTLANLQSLQFLADRGCTGYLVGEKYIATVVRNGALTFSEKADGILSVFCMGQNAQNVTLKGLKYELTNGTLSAGFPLGVSNHFIGKTASITVKNGSLLLLYDRENGLPEREVFL